jgi:hypothetical protein
MGRFLSMLAIGSAGALCGISYRFAEMHVGCSVSIIVLLRVGMESRLRDKSKGSSMGGCVVSSTFRFTSRDVNDIAFAYFLLYLPLCVRRFDIRIWMEPSHNYSPSPR